MPSAVSLFTGCMGLDLGLEAAGWDILWTCESDQACQRVIQERRPSVPIIPDVREVDAGFPSADLLAGGFPCQDLSNAGRGAGLDGEQSGLWLEMFKSIRVLRPRRVLVENVPGIFSKMGSRPGESAFGTVIGDLAEAGYVGRWVRLLASDVGAPHGRDRVFVLAVASDADRAGREEHGGALSVRTQLGPAERGRGEAPADTAELGRPARARLREGEQAPVGRGRPDNGGGETEWGVYAPAVRDWERILGRAAPPPTDARGRLEPAFVEWMLGYPEGWTDVDGVTRAQRLRMLGNSVQVQCGEVVGRMLRA